MVRELFTTVPSIFRTFATFLTHLLFPYPLPLNAPYVDSRINSNPFTMGNPNPESTLSPSQGLRILPLHITIKYMYMRTFTLTTTSLLSSSTEQQR
jgi:hypothetical protein